MNSLLEKGAEFFLVLSLYSLVAAPSGRAEETLLSKKHSLLQSSLSSSSEIFSLFDKGGTPPLYTPRTSAICQSLGTCVEATFYDSPDFIQSGPPGSEQLRNSTAAARVSYVLPDSGFRSVQFELQRELEDGSRYCPITFGSKFASYVGIGSEQDRGCLTARFRKKGLLDPTPTTQEDLKATRADFGHYVIGEMSADDFAKDVLNRPKAFPVLPALVEAARSSGRKDIIQTLQQTTENALLLTLDALIPIADSSNPINPFFRFDRLVPSHSLLSVEKLYRKLWNADPKLNRWPEVVDLTPDLRAQLKGIYNERSVKTSRWKVKGFYEEKKNQIAIDLTNDFYENAFVYFHELWHVAWTHSEPGNRQLEAILASLRDAKPDPAQIRRTLLLALSANEFQAIDQQIRLFHAVGELAQDWGQSEIPSTQAWEASHLGPNSTELLELRRSDRGDDWFYRTARTKDVSFGFVQQFYEALHRKSARSKYRDKLNSVEATFDSNYWQQQAEIHAKLFELVYFGGELGLSRDLQTIAPDVLLDSFENPEIPVLTCREVTMVEQALDAQWQFGFPFEYQLSESDASRCADGKPGPKLPGTEGSHATEELDLGLLSKPSAFPSLEGPELELRQKPQ